MLSSRYRHAAAAGLMVLVLSIQLGNWAGYAWCKATLSDRAAALRDCGCDLFLSGTYAAPGSTSTLGSTSFKSLSVEAMPECGTSELPCIDITTQRGLSSPASHYLDPYADALFRPPGQPC